MATDALGDRMKAYERQETAQRFLPLLPLYARIDGRGFSKFTRGLDRPYDARFRALMLETTRWLVAQTNARAGYTQSDEISLCWLSERYDSPVFFDGKKQKMLGQLAAMATQRFNRLLWTSDDPFLRELALRDPTFDARAFQFPNRTECVNAFVWRELDATKNAMSMAAREFYPHKALLGKNGSDLNELLFQKGVNFNDYPAAFKRGVYVQRRRRVRPLSPEQLARIPEDRRPPGGVVERSEVVALDLPPLLRVPNRVGVLFDGEDPAPALAPTLEAPVARPLRP